MTRLHKKLINNFLILALFAFQFSLTAGEAEKHAVSELLDIIQFDKQMDASINATTQMIKQMNPNADNLDVKLKKFFKLYMSAESLRQDLVEMYAEIFTENELKEIIAFYKTYTGQKALEKLPEIMQRSMQIGQTRVMQHIGELEEILAQE